METYLIRTFGCQMNKHDSERVAGLLTAQGMRPVEVAEEADVVVFMTCCVRENADERLRGQARSLKSTKAGRPGQLIAIGGCIGQRDGEKLLEQVPHLDVVFGTHNLANLPALLDLARRQRLPQVEVLAETQGFASDLPTEREHPWHAWVPITIGCDNFCTYCIVPHVSGREKSRPLAEIESEVLRLVADGVQEVTLLGRTSTATGEISTETSVSPKCCAPSRQRELSGFALPPHIPRIFRTIRSQRWQTLRPGHAVLASADPVRLGRGPCRHESRLHAGGLSPTSGTGTLRPSSAWAISTDIIVGFPGETDSDFDATLHVVSEVGYDPAFTFIYSPREGTPAASLVKASSPGRVAVPIRSTCRNRPPLGSGEQQVDLSAACSGSYSRESANVMTTCSPEGRRRTRSCMSRCRTGSGVDFAVEPSMSRSLRHRRGS